MPLESVSSSLLWPVLLALLLSGCETRGDASQMSSVQGQSAGPLLAPEVRFTAHPEMTVGGWADHSLALQDVRGAVFLPGGELWLASAARGEVLRFSASGELLGVLGGRGDGPGEIGRGPYGLHLCDGRVLVDEQFRYTFFSTSGDFEEVVNVPPYLQASIPSTVGIAGDCSAVLILLGEVPTPRAGVFRGHDVMAWLNLPGGDIDTLVVVEGAERFSQEIGGQIQPSLLPFGSKAVWAQWGDSVYLGDSSTPELTLVSAEGDTIRSFRWAAPSRAIQEQEKAAMEIARRQQIQESPVLADFLPALETFPLPTRVPATSSVTVSAGGYVWVRAYPQFSDGFGQSVKIDEVSQDRIFVFRPDGSLFRIVQIPAGLEILEIDNDRIATLHYDEMQAPVVEVFRLPEW